MFHFSFKQLSDKYLQLFPLTRQEVASINNLFFKLRKAQIRRLHVFSHNMWSKLSNNQIDKYNFIQNIISDFSNFSNKVQ